jgi:hypothetical protein
MLGLPDWHTGRQYVEDIDKADELPAGYTAAYNALGQQYYRSAHGGAGKEGGAGNVNPGSDVDNSWDDLNGLDPRTDEQKFYDRNLSNFSEIADQYGHYNWYADETGYDPKNPDAKRHLNLDELADRTSGQIAGSETPDYYVRKPDATFSGHDYEKYNHSQSKDFFDDAMRSRKNLSVYGRTA